MSDPASRRSMLQRPGSDGLRWRIVLLLVLEAVALVIVMTLRSTKIWFASVPSIEIVLIAAAVSLAMALGLVFTEIPRGVENTFTRLGLATFCRTGLPLLVVIAISKYSMGDPKIQPIFAAVVFYAVGHFGGIILGTLPLKS